METYDVYRKTILSAKESDGTPLKRLGTVDAKLDEDGFTNVLIVIDMQKDFVPGGSLAVAEGDEIEGEIKALIADDRFHHIFASKDFHPPGHCSFTTGKEGGYFAPHCVQVYGRQEITMQEKNMRIEEFTGKEPETVIPDGDYVETHGGGGGEDSGAKFTPYVQVELQKLHEKNNDKVEVFFKAFNQTCDSFGAMPYANNTTDGPALQERRKEVDAEGRPKLFSECADVMTGSYGFDLKDPFDIDSDPVDSRRSWQILTHSDHVRKDSFVDAFKHIEGGTTTMESRIKALAEGGKTVRLFVCGLTMDYCVLDTARNAKFLCEGVDVNIILDATRPVRKDGKYYLGAKQFVEKTPDIGLLTMPVAIDTYKDKAEAFLKTTLGSAPSSGVSVAFEGNWVAMKKLLKQDLAMEIIDAGDELYDYAISDVYKARMHKMYANYFGGVQAKFSLKVRKSPMTGDSSVWDAMAKSYTKDNLVQLLAKANGIKPYHADFGGNAALGDPNPEIHEDFAKSQIAAVKQEPGNSLTWSTEVEPLINASHAETNTMQLVQESIIWEQARQHGITRRDMLASGLARLVALVTAINTAPFKPIALFAGRRSSSREFLFLSNLYCASKMKGFIGTSASALNQFICRTARPRQEMFERLVHKDVMDIKTVIPFAPTSGLMLIGTHAHEQQMVSQRLLGGWDPLVNLKETFDTDTGQAKASVSTLVPHLLFVLTHLPAKLGTTQITDKTIDDVEKVWPEPAVPWFDIRRVTALADTYGTPSFVAAACAAKLPRAFLDDLKERVPAYYKYLQAWSGGANEDISKLTVFDLIRVWRMDSGNYKTNCKLINDVYWQRRTKYGFTTLPLPKFLHSYMESAGDVIEYKRHTNAKVATNAEEAAATGPDTWALGFGSLTDNFLPFTVKGVKEDVEIGMSSLVMKAVNASFDPKDAGRAAKYDSGLGTAGKLSDEAGKEQIDSTLTPEQKETALAAFHAYRNGYLVPGAKGPITYELKEGKDKQYYGKADPPGEFRYTFNPIAPDSEGLVTERLNYEFDLAFKGFPAGVAEMSGGVNPDEEGEENEEESEDEEEEEGDPNDPLDPDDSFHGDTTDEDITSSDDEYIDPDLPPDMSFPDKVSASRDLEKVRQPGPSATYGPGGNSPPTPEGAEKMPKTAGGRTAAAKPAWIAAIAASIAGIAAVFGLA